MTMESYLPGNLSQLQCFHDLNEQQIKLKLHWFNINCTHNLCTEEWRSLNLVRSVLAFLGLLMVLAILVFLICYKAYSSLFQRLYLYLIIATLLNELVGVVSIEHQWHYSRQETVCVWIGLFLGWTYVLLFIFSYEIIAYLIFLVLTMMKGIEFSQYGAKCTRICALTVEFVLIVLPILISTAFAIPPYVQGRYGIAGPWCFVRSLNYNCTPTGKVIQLAFYSMYMALGVAGIAVTVIFLLVYCKLSTAFREIRILLKRTLYVLVFKFVHILMITCSVACRVYTLMYRQHEQYGLWLLHALAVPLGVLVFPLGYFLCFHPVGTTARVVYRKVIQKCCKHIPSLNYDGEQSMTLLRATAPASNRISQPSSTFFFVPHSDQLSEGSHVHPVSDTGYGSTSLSH